MNAAARLRGLRRRTMSFSLLGLMASVVLLAVLGGQPGSGHGPAILDVLTRASLGGPRFELSHGPALVAVGIAAGMFAGILGMGGGVMKVSGMLVVFHLDILLARAVSLTTMFVASTTAAWVHSSSGTVVWPAVRRMVLPSIGGVIVGTVLGSELPRATLTRTFALFAIFLAFNVLGHCFGDPHEHSMEGRSWKQLGKPSQAGCIWVGGLHGLACGLLGISGGVVTIPLQQALLGISSRAAIGNAVVVSAACTAVGGVLVVVMGVVSHDFLLRDVLIGSIWIGGGAFVGAQIGARLSKAIPIIALRVCFIGITAAAALSILAR